MQQELLRPQHQPPFHDTDTFKQELAEAIQQIRSEFHRISAEHRAEADRLYQTRLEQIQQQRDREALAMSEKVRSLQAEMDRLRHSNDEAQHEVSKTHFLCLFFRPGYHYLGEERRKVFIFQ